MDGNPVQVRAEQAAGDSASTVTYAVNTFLAMLKVNDALRSVARRISGQRRRACGSGSTQRWWPSLNRQLYADVVTPLIEELSAFHPEGGYASELITQTVQEATSPLLHSRTESALPRDKTDLRLVDEFLQDAFDKFRVKLIAQNREAEHTNILRQIEQLTLREWFKADRGNSLRLLLENLVASEPRSVPKKHLTDDCSLLGMSGVMVSLSPDEAEAWGICPEIEEHTVSEEDAWESQADLVSYSDVDLGNVKLGWYECDTEAKTVLFAVSLVQQRVEGRKKVDRRQQASARLDSVFRRNYFCESCDELTQWHHESQHPTVRSAVSSQYCTKHAVKAFDSGRSLDYLIHKILSEARRDPSYMGRFVGGVEGSWKATTEHLRSCRHCSRQAWPHHACLDPSSEIFPYLMAFHANVRKVAARLRDSYCDSRACDLDDAVQDGEIAKTAARRLGLTTDKAAGQYGELALARLIFQGLKGAALAQRLGVWANAVSERKSALRGIFDFSLGRDRELIFFPFDDVAIDGPCIIKFPTGPMDKSWRHSEDEYRHLSRSSIPIRKITGVK